MRSGRTGSGKADAYFTGERENEVWGVIFEVDPAEKPNLDRHEGLGHGYVEKQITVIDVDGNHRPVFMYAAEETHIDPALRQYSWYKRFILEGARQHRLPLEYITMLEAVEAIEDADKARDAEKPPYPLLREALDQTLPLELVRPLLTPLKFRENHCPGTTFCGIQQAFPKIRP